MSNADRYLMHGKPKIRKKWDDEFKNKKKNSNRIVCNLS